MKVKVRHNLAKERKEHNISLEEMASLLEKELGKEVSADKVHRWETSQVKPGIDTLLAYSKIFNTNITFLLGYTHVNFPNKTDYIDIRALDRENASTIATNSGVHILTVMKYRNLHDINSCTLRISKIFCNYLHCSIDYFLGLTNYITWEHAAVDEKRFDLLPEGAFLQVEAVKGSKEYSSVIKYIGKGPRSAIYDSVGRDLIFSNKVLLSIDDVDLLDSCLIKYVQNTCEDIY